MRTGVLTATAVGLALAACAGRDPQPVATVQPQDQFSDCAMIRAEIEANNQKVTQIANEQGWKVAQNVSAGVIGFVFPPLWFGMDFKDAAGKDAAALQARQQFLTSMATERCRPQPRVAAAPPPSRAAATKPKVKPKPEPESDEPDAK